MYIYIYIYIIVNIACVCVCFHIFPLFHFYKCQTPILIQNQCNKRERLMSRSNSLKQVQDSDT